MVRGLRLDGSRSETVGMMKGLIVLVVLVAIARFVSSDQCELKLSDKEKTKLTPLQQKVLDKLSVDVTLECGDSFSFSCHQVKDNDPDVAVDRSNRTGCRCHKEAEAYDCRCCFKLKKWKYLMCVAAALEVKDPYKFMIFATFEDRVFARFNVPLKALANKYIPVCIPCVLPPPIDWLSPCFKFKFEVPSPANGNVWKICGKIKIGIYLVPIWTIYTKCFEIPKKIDSMTIEGQPNLDQDVEPGYVKVKDGKNTLPVVCLANKKKDIEINCKSARGDVCPRPLPPIPVNNKINWQKSESEQSPFLVRLYVDNPLINIQDFPDDDKYPFLQELRAEAMTESWMDNVPNRVDYPGASCGGVVLTGKMVLTNCACVRSFYAAHKLGKDVDNLDESLYDLTSTVISLRFTDDTLDRFYLDPDGTKMIGSSKCSSAIAAGDPAEVLQTLVIAMPITPEFKPTKKAAFVGWPPKVLQSTSIVNLVAYGLATLKPNWVFKDGSGTTIDFDKTAVDFFLKLCSQETNYCQSVTSKAQSAKDRLRCLCVKESGFQLVDGEIGYPVTVNRQLFGLNSLPIENGTEGSTLVTIFDDDTKKEIELFVGLGTASPRSTSVILILSTAAFQCYVIR